MSVVTARFPLMSWLARVHATPMRCANSVCVIVSGLRNSSRIISPGWDGGPCVGMRVMVMFRASW